MICGHIGYARVKQSGGALVGRGLALAGLIMGYISIGLLVAFIPISMLATIAVPSFVRARDTSMQRACDNNLRLIDSARAQYALEHNSTVPDWKQLVGAAGTLKQMPACPKGGAGGRGAAGRGEPAGPSCSGA